jgi:SAM-dependent methyltransferase
MSETFDRAYYRRFYYDPKTRVQGRAEVERLGNFVCSYVRYLGLNVRRVVDLGCGIGLWGPVVARHFPRARYVGVEISEYLCERYGFERGSVVDYEARAPFDLVICQGVLPYLSPRECKKAMKNLQRLCRGALYLEAVTREDWDGGVLDRRLTDRAMALRPAAFYRKGLLPALHPVGGGVFVHRAAAAPLYALERG